MKAAIVIASTPEKASLPTGASLNCGVEPAAQLRSASLTACAYRFTRPAYRAAREMT